MRALTLATISAIVVSQLAATPVLAQMTTMPVPEPVTPTPLPAPTPQPVRPTPLPQPVRPSPQIQPVRPGPQIQPPRPGPQIQPPRPAPVIQPPRPVRPLPPVNPGYDQNQYTGTIDCRSRGNRVEVCRVSTANRVVLLRQLGGRCVRGSNWSFSHQDIRVWNGCYGRFGYGYSNGYPTPLPQPVPDRGPSAGAVIAGVIVAGGLIALLASAAKKKNAAAPESVSPFPPGPPASVSADLSGLQASARPTMQNCLFAASKEIGVTGGSRMRLDRITKVEPGNGGWRFNAELTSTYPDGDRATPIYCRATPTKIVQLDFTG